MQCNNRMKWIGQFKPIGRATEDEIARLISIKLEALAGECSYRGQPICDTCYYCKIRSLNYSKNVRSGFKLPKGVGVHAIRRKLETELRKASVGNFDLYRFMHWTATSRMFGMIPVCDKTSPELGDHKVLEAHPFVQTWIEAIPYLQKHAL